MATSRTANHEDVARLFGAITDHALLRILKTGATLEQLEQVALWLAQENDVPGSERLPLSGVPAEVLFVLRQEADPEAEEDR